jgi:hypothetical protein
VITSRFSTLLALVRKVGAWGEGGGAHYGNRRHLLHSLPHFACRVRFCTANLIPQAQLKIIIFCRI